MAYSCLYNGHFQSGEGLGRYEKSIADKWMSTNDRIGRFLILRGREDVTIGCERLRSKGRFDAAMDGHYYYRAICGPCSPLPQPIHNDGLFDDDPRTPSPVEPPSVAGIEPTNVFFPKEVWLNIFKRLDMDGRRVMQRAMSDKVR